MYNLFLALHLLAAIFAVGPLVHAAATAGRGVRTGDGVATASASRTSRIYAYASLAVVVIGFGLMSAKDPDTHQAVAKFSQTWIWLSLLLWVVAMALVLAVLVPTLDKATQLIAKQESVVALTARVGAAGGIVGLLFAVIVFLMVYRPGS